MEYFEFSLIISWLRCRELKRSKDSIGRKALSPIFVDAAASQERAKCSLRYVIVLTDTSIIYRVCGAGLLHREAGYDKELFIRRVFPPVSLGKRTSLSPTDRDEVPR